MATTYTFRPTERRQAKLRMALGGPAGSGKTMTALIVASYLGDRIALIDSERGSSQKYADEPGLPPFDVLTLEAFSPEEYIAAIKAAKEADYPVLIIDSISHAWAGPGGILELVDQVTLSSKSKNAYTEGWRKATPLHNRFVDTMLQYPGHLIMTVRSKIARVIEDEGPKKGTPRIIGMEWVQRDSMEYEVDVAGELDKENTLVITKSRCQALHGQVFVKPGQEFATILVKWLSSGAPTETRDAHPTPLPPEARSDLMSRQQATAEGTLPPLAGANGPHVNRGDRQLAQTKQEVILDIVAALKRKYPGDDKTAKQDRADLAREYFGTDVFADFKALPLSLLRDGLARLTRPVIGERPSEPDDDVPTHAPPGTVEVGGEPTDPRTGEVFRPAESVVTSVEPMDDESATESLLAQLERYAESQGMTPAWQALMQDYETLRLEDGALVLTGDERTTLLAQAEGVWPGVSDVVRLA